MKIIALTGSIAMGKSSTLKMFRSLGIPTHDSDQVVHDFYEGEAADILAADFADAISDGKVDRLRLSEIIVQSPDRLQTLENLVHPHVEARRNEFVNRHKTNGARLVLVDIPLLFEIRGETDVDIVAVVSAGKEIQKQRALSRPNMTIEKFNTILAKQMPDAQKRKKAHVTIDTSISFEDTRMQVQAFLRAIS